MSADQQAYEAARADYWAQRDRTQRGLEALRRNPPWENDFDDWLVYGAERDLRVRQADHAGLVVLATAPPEAAEWWPGGWYATTPWRGHGYGRRPGQPEGTDVWPTEEQARAARPDDIAEPDWIVRWTPVAHGRSRKLAGRRIALDAPFWTGDQESWITAPANRTLRTAVA